MSLVTTKSLLGIVLLSLVYSTVAISSNPPISSNIFQKSTNKDQHEFKWKASIDCVSGRASAIEVSTLLLTDKKTKNLKHVAKELVNTYPKWLSHWSVTGGILRSTPYRSHSKNQSNAWAIRDTIFGMNLLIFGRMQAVPNYIMENDKLFKKSRKKVTVELPIIGGIFTVQDTEMKKSDQIKQSTYGSIRFSFVEEKIKKGKRNLNEKQTHRLFLKSEIVDYPPTIAGSKRPVSQFRKKIYLASQPLIHAYVMWRYHARCREIFNSHNA